jgi:hypothetical protein
VKKITNCLLLACALVLASTPLALAQGPDQPARAFVAVSGGFQMVSRSVTETGAFTLYDEPGSFTGARKISNGAIFDIGVGAHVTGSISVGVAYSRFTKPADVPFTVVAPHPLFFNQPRTATLNVTGLGHTEDAIHLQVFYQLLSSGRYEASVFAGPSFFMVKQDMVTSVTATETGSPFTAVNLNATFGTEKKNAIGANAGLGINYRLSGSLGAGFFVRYTMATAKMPSASVRAGGPQVGASLRYGF